MLPPPAPPKRAQEPHTCEAALHLYRQLESARANTAFQVQAAERRAEKRQRRAEELHSEVESESLLVITMLQNALGAAARLLESQRSVAGSAVDESVRIGAEAAAEAAEKGLDLSIEFPRHWGLRLFDKRVRESSYEGEMDVGVVSDLADESLTELVERAKDDTRGIFI
mmetsp:Transcript_8626/g.25500  ORF Transcript_8626/g.25500 Transcript_8626/m.25500 type:complete len:169 (+) Transcript_8626:1-507(+)